MKQQTKPEGFNGQAKVLAYAIKALDKRKKKHFNKHKVHV